MWVFGVDTHQAIALPHVQKCVTLKFSFFLHLYQ